MSNSKVYKQYGFFAALTMMISSVVGIGIFVKNESIFSAAENNSVSVLIAWIIGGVISLLAALSFSEVYRDDGSRTSGGLAGLAEKYVGLKFGRFVKFTYGFFYFPILVSVFPLFIYMFLATFVAGDSATAEISITGALVAMVVGSILLVATTALLPRVSSGIMQITLLVKMLPLILGALAGLFFTKNGGGLGNTLGGASKSSESVMSLALAAMPGVLFAFDAFANVGTIAPKVKGANRTIPLAIFSGMIFVSILYILITVSQINHNQGTISGLLDSVFGNELKAVSSMVFFAIVVSGTGTANALTTAGVNFLESLYKDKLLPGSKHYRETLLPLRGGMILAVTSSIYAFVFFGLKIMLGDVTGMNDVFLDSISNLPVLFFLPIYAITFIGLAIKKIRNGDFNIRSIYYYAIAAIASIGILIIVGYQFYDLFASFSKWNKSYIKHSALIIGLIMFFSIPFLGMLARNMHFMTDRKNKFWIAVKMSLRLELG